MPDNSDEAKWQSERRAFLKLSGMAGITTLAGCSSEKPTKGDDGSTNTNSGDNNKNSNGNSGDQALTLAARYVPKDIQWNSYAPSHFAQVGGKFVFDPFLRYNQKTDELIPYLLKDWELKGKQLTVNLRQGDTWHDGTDVTAKDVVTKFKIDKGFETEIATYIEEAKAVDDTTVQYSLGKEYREKNILTILSGSWLDTPKSKYGKFAKRFDDASTTEETQKVQSDVQNYQPKEPLGSGPYQFEVANQQNLKLSKYEDHPHADKVKVPECHFSYYSSQQQQWASMKNSSGLDVVDGFTPIRVAKTFPDYVTEYKVPEYNGYALVFNHEDEDFKNRNVRRAIAYVIDQHKMAKLADPLKTAVTKPVGVGSFITDTWKKNLGGDVGVYEGYNDTSKAATLLKQEGYTKKGGQWHKPNGDQFTLTIPSPSGWTDIANFTSTVAQLLSDFGIKAQNNSVENTTYFGQYWGSTNYKIAPWFWNNSGQTKPFFSLSWILTSDTVMSNLKYEEKPRAPPMGKPNATPTSTNVRDMLRTLGTSSDQGEITKNVRELAWVVNQSLPVLPLIEKIHPSFWNGKDWNIPPKETDKKYIEWCSYWYPRVGLVSPK